MCSHYPPGLLHAVFPLRALTTMHNTNTAARGAQKAAGSPQLPSTPLRPGPALLTGGTCARPTLCSAAPQDRSTSLEPWACRGPTASARRGHVSTQR